VRSYLRAVVEASRVTGVSGRRTPAGTVVVRAAGLRDTYLTRRSASETTFGDDKTTITGAGNRSSGPVLRSGSPRLVIQESWAWLTATQLVRASAAVALRTEAAAARALRRRSRAPVIAEPHATPRCGTRAATMPATLSRHQKNRLKERHEHKGSNTPEQSKRLKYAVLGSGRLLACWRGRAGQLSL
jgi:hypothetical protein